MALDLTQAEAFIHALTGSPSTVVVFQLADDRDRKIDKTPPRKDFERVIIGTVREHAQILGKLNSLGAAVWVQVNEGRRGARNVTGLRACFVDDDGKSDEPPRITLQPSIVVASSAGGRNRHYYWRLKAGEPVERFVPVQKQLIAALSTDKSIHNLDRVMRLPGTSNMKRANANVGEPEPVRLVYADTSGKRYGLDELSAAFPVDEVKKRELLAEPQPDLFTPEALKTAARIAGWLRGHEITFAQPTMITFKLAHCVFNPQHRDMMIKAMPRGGVWAGCFHDSCGGNVNRWSAVKDRIGDWRSDGATFSRGDGVEIANRLLKDLANGNDDPIVHTDGHLYRYKSTLGLWEPVLDSEQERMIASYAGAQLGEKRRLAVGAGTIRDAQNCARALAGQDGFFVEGAPGIAFANGFLGITPAGAAFMPHDAGHRQTVGLHFSYDPHALAPRWFRFLGECFQGDPDAADKIAILQEFVGACLIGIAPRFEKVLILVGDGANGKSVFTKTIGSLFPAEVRCAIKPQVWGNEYYAAALAGKRINIVGELPDNDILSGDAFKEITTGERISARWPSGRPFEYFPVAGHIFNANRLPGTSDQSWGFWRRQLVITFNRIFGEGDRDVHLADYLRANELPGILMWAVRGAERIAAQQSYTKAASDAEAREQWRRDVDPVAAFVHDCCEAESLAVSGVQAQALYATFKAWLVDNGHKVLSSTAFGRRLRGLGIAREHRRDGWFYALKLLVPIPVTYFLQ